MESKFSAGLSAEFAGSNLPEGIPPAACRHGFHQGAACTLVQRCTCFGCPGPIMSEIM